MVAVEIEAFEFSRLKERRDGEIPVAGLPRLAKECAATFGTLRWAVIGGMHESGYPQLSMTVAGDVQLTCQRCLQPYVHAIESTATLVLARSDLQADQIEATLDDDSLDVIVVAPAMDLIELIEDEALLSIPQAPKHDQCPESEAASLENNAKKPSPFAALKDLRH